MEPTIICEKCGKECECQEDGMDCPECEQFFCDNCYDCGLGDGCRCHNLTEADMTSKTQHGVDP
jgi:hypothetical protein